MSNKELNDKMKEVTGKATVLEAKMEVGRRLGIVFSIGYAEKGGAEPWEVLLDSRGFTVLAGEPVDSVNGSVIPPGDPVVAMVEERALEYIQNPALLFARDRGRQGLILARWDSRPMLTPWINPNEMPRLWNEAYAAEKKSEELNGRKPTIITFLDSDEYLRRANEGTDRCPKCDGEGRHLQWSDSVYDQRSFSDLIVKVRCGECEAVWQERYKLAKIETLKVEEEHINAEKV